jgi:hypothetical protein
MICLKLVSKLKNRYKDPGKFNELAGGFRLLPEEIPLYPAAAPNPIEFRENMNGHNN